MIFPKTYPLDGLNPNYPAEGVACESHNLSWILHSAQESK